MEQSTYRKRLRKIYADLQKKGYRPIEQLVGYILTEDPTYITSYNGARKDAARLDRDELLKDIIVFYFAED